MPKQLLLYNFHHPLYGHSGKYRWVGTKSKAKEFLKECHKLWRSGFFDLDLCLNTLKDKSFISIFMTDWPLSHLYLAAYFIDLESQILEHYDAPNKIYSDWIQSLILKTFKDSNFSMYTTDVTNLIKFTNFLSFPTERYFSILSILKYLWEFPEYPEKIITFYHEKWDREKKNFIDLRFSHEKKYIIDFCSLLFDIGPDIDILKYSEFDSISLLIVFLEKLLDEIEERFL